MQLNRPFPLRSLVRYQLHDLRREREHKEEDQMPPTAKLFSSFSLSVCEHMRSAAANKREDEDIVERGPAAAVCVLCPRSNMNAPNGIDAVASCEWIKENPCSSQVLLHMAELVRQSSQTM